MHHNCTVCRSPAISSELCFYVEVEQTFMNGYVVFLQVSCKHYAYGLQVLMCFSKQISVLQKPFDFPVIVEHFQPLISIVFLETH